jgi:hypothetical protein
MAKLYEYELGKSADMMIRVIGRVVDIKGGDQAMEFVSIPQYGWMMKKSWIMEL